MRKLTLVLWLLVLSVCLCGCDFWMSGEYVSEKPHTGGDVLPVADEAEAKNEQEIQTFLTQMVESGTENSVIYISALTDVQVRSGMDAAIEHVTCVNPIGAYAVSKIQYELGTRTGRSAVAVTVTYSHGRSEILRIAQPGNVESVISYLTQALEECDTALVLRIENIGKPDFEQLVRDYVEQNPDVCMELPQVAVNYYPQEGDDQVLEILFTYQNNPDDLRQMQERVSTVFASAQLYVSGDAQPREKLSQLYSFLMERYDYTVETSITPSYSLLHYGVGDSKAFALVYATMCKRAGLQCQIVSGTREGTPWHWNLILEDGQYYHLDLLRSNESGQFTMLLPEEMNGYVWDYEAAPVDQTQSES